MEKPLGDFRRHVCGKRHEAPTPTAKTTWHSLIFEMRKSEQKIDGKTESTKFKGGLYTLKKQETTSIVKGSVNETTLFHFFHHLPLARSIAGCPTSKIQKTFRFTKEHWSGYTKSYCLKPPLTETTNLSSIWYINSVKAQKNWGTFQTFHFAKTEPYQPSKHKCDLKSIATTWGWVAFPFTTNKKNKYTNIGSCQSTATVEHEG